MLSPPQPCQRKYPCSNPQNQSFFGKQAFMDLIKTSSCTMIKGPKSKSGVLLRDRSWETGRVEKMALCKCRQRMEWCHHKPGNAWSLQKLEKIENDSTQSQGRGAWPVNTLISDFQSTGLWENTFLWETSAGKIVVVCYGSPRKLRHSPGWFSLEWLARKKL